MSTNQKIILVASLWLLSLAGAFTLGKYTFAPKPPEEHPDKTLADAQLQSRLEAKAAFKKVETVEGVERDMRDPLSALQDALQITDPLKRMAAIAAALADLEADRIPEAVAFYEGLPDSSFKRQFYNLLLQTWGRIDGEAALAYVLEKSDGNTRGGRFGGMRDAFPVLTGWAETQPEAAVAWALENGSEGRRGNPLLFAAVQGWASQDIQAAAAFVLENDDIISRNRFIDNVIGQYASQDPVAATHWALGQSDSADRNQALQIMGESLARDNLDTALTWANNIGDPDAQREAQMGILEGLASNDPETALKQIDSIVGEANSAEATQAVIRQWARQDSMAAAEYITNMESGSTKDSASQAISHAFSRYDTEMALLFAESIEDDSLREQTLVEMYQEWMQNDPEGTREMIDASSLDDATKIRILSP